MQTVFDGVFSQFAFCPGEIEIQLSTIVESFESSDINFNGIIC